MSSLSTRVNGASRHRRRVVACLGLASLVGLTGSFASVAHAADVFKGHEIYRSFCETCHSMDGQGQVPGVPNFIRGEGLRRSDLGLFEILQSGKGSMPAYRGILAEREILDVISYLRTLQR